MMQVLPKSHEQRIADLERLVADLQRVVGAPSGVLNGLAGQPSQFTTFNNSALAGQSQSLGTNEANAPYMGGQKAPL